MPVYMPPILPDKRDGLLGKNLPRKENGDELSDDDCEDVIMLACCKRMSDISVKVPTDGGGLYVSYMLTALHALFRVLFCGKANRSDA